MILRKLRVNWRYAAGEIAIIVIGILVAIALDNFNDSRNARRLEREYLRRLVDDLKADTATFGFVACGLTRKSASLAFADSIVTRNIALRDTLRFLQALVLGSNFAWNQPRLRPTTFDELQSTGNLRLLRDHELRAKVVRYYTAARLHLTRLAATLLGSDLASAIVAERNLAVFVAEMNVGLKQRALELLRDLERSD